MAALHAGIPVSVPISTVNRQCSSGLTAVNTIANEIIAGQIDIGIGTSSHQISETFSSLMRHEYQGAGVESMTFGYGPTSQPDGWSDAVMTTKEAEDCLIPMGFTSENVASDYGISRQVQDQFAAESYRKAATAQKAGKFKAEILPIKVTIVDPKTDKESQIVVDSDDGIRDGVTAESLAKLKPAFSKTGSTHAGASRISYSCPLPY
jgi:acetyl-CoA acyltransferase 1